MLNLHIVEVKGICYAGKWENPSDEKVPQQRNRLLVRKPEMYAQIGYKGNYFNLEPCSNNQQIPDGSGVYLRHQQSYCAYCLDD